MLTYILVGMVGVVFLLFSLVGGGHEGHDIGHDVGHDAGGHDGDHGGAGPSIFSPLAIAFFLMGFGGAGMIARVYKVSMGWSAVIALATGVALYAVCFLFLSVLYRSQGDSTVTSAKLVNRTAVVTLAVPKNGMGKASCSGIAEELCVRSKDGEPIAANTAVHIVGSAGGGVCIVEKA